MTRASKLPAPWAALAAAYGGVEKLATRLGVHRNTITRWGAGDEPVPMVRRAVEQMARRKGVTGLWPVASEAGRDAGPR